MDNRLYGESVSDAVVEHENNSKQYGLTVAKVGVASIPLVFAPTSPLAAVIGIGLSEGLGLLASKFSELQQTRKVEMLTLFSEKVKDKDADVLIERFSEPNFQQLFEQGLYEAARNTAKDKLNAIAKILATGVNPNEHLAILKRILQTFSRLEDLDFLLLELLNAGGKDFPSEKKVICGGDDEYVIPVPIVHFSELQRTTYDWCFSQKMVRDGHFQISFTTQSIQRLTSETLVEAHDDKNYNLTLLGADFIRYLHE